MDGAALVARPSRAAGPAIGALLDLAAPVLAAHLAGLARGRRAPRRALRGDHLAAAVRLVRVIAEGVSAAVAVLHALRDLPRRDAAHAGVVGNAVGVAAALRPAVLVARARFWPAGAFAPGSTAPRARTSRRSRPQRRRRHRMAVAARRAAPSASACAARTRPARAPTPRTTSSRPIIPGRRGDQSFIR